MHKIHIHKSLSVSIYICTSLASTIKAKAVWIETFQSQKQETNNIQAFKLPKKLLSGKKLLSLVLWHLSLKYVNIHFSHDCDWEITHLVK